MLKDTSVIPKGDYCYSWIETPSEQNNWRGKVKLCPYYKPKTIDNIDLPWCDFLDLGGIPASGKWRGWDNDGVDKVLSEHFGSEEKRDAKLCLDLLFDQCKECGINE